jgi:hypothetical protein
MGGRHIPVPVVLALAVAAAAAMYGHKARAHDSAAWSSLSRQHLTDSKVSVDVFGDKKGELIRGPQDASVRMIGGLRGEAAPLQMRGPHQYLQRQPFRQR